MIAIGIIRRAHGVRGEASVEVWSDGADRITDFTEVTLASPDEKERRPVTIETVRIHAGRALVKFAGIETPEDVQKLQNWTLDIEETDARELDEDEYFLHDLIGLKLVDDEGRDRGQVAEAFEGGSGILLSVTRNDGRTFELPFAADLCRTIDLQAGTILVTIPDGLDDLDAIPE